MFFNSLDVTATAALHGEAATRGLSEDAAQEQRRGQGHRGEDLRGRQEAARADGREPALQRGDTTSRPISFFFLE